MGCGCGKKRIRRGTASHSEIYNNLKSGVCRIDLKNNKQVYCTLSENAIPAEGSSRHKDIKTDIKNEQIVVWAFNKNINNKLDASAGWFKISVKDIDSYEYIGEVQYKENSK